MYIFAKFGLDSGEIDVGPCYGNGEYDEDTKTCTCEPGKAYGERCQFTWGFKNIMFHGRGPFNEKVLKPYVSQYALEIYDHQKYGIIDGLYMNHEFFQNDSKKRAKTVKI